MAIDARVKYVLYNADRSGALVLEDRPGTPKGIAGQSRLIFASAPDDVAYLTGQEIWGGAESLLVGNKVFARRRGYTEIVFTANNFAGFPGAKTYAGEIGA